MGSLISHGNPRCVIGAEELEKLLTGALAALGSPRRVLLIPPDFTRFNSAAGRITAILYGLLSEAEVDILPALGTHAPMTSEELRCMFGEDIPPERFIVHDWRRELVHCGDVPGEKLAEWSEGKVDYPVRIEVNARLFADYDIILSIGQVVPHEVVGMANYTKNICVGVGGQDTINKSHFLGAVYGMERIMGRANTPVRHLFNYGCREFLSDLPIHYILTVMEKDQAGGRMNMRGLFMGDGDESFTSAARLSQEVNLEIIPEALNKVLVYLDPEEFKSTWLGNKSVYRTRMAMADGGELIVLAPGLREFGEDPEIDRLIRKYGYRGTDRILQAVNDNEDLRSNLSAAAHLIHGSSEGRFRITYCPGPRISAEDIRNVGFDPGDLQHMLSRYKPESLRDGWNDIHGERIFFISNPGLGLWAEQERFRINS